jgi:hypothetical protein
MPRRGNRLRAVLAACVLALGACNAEPPAAADKAPANPQAERPLLGLMTSLPLYWPEGADLATLVSGTAPIPWQRRAMETRFELVPLDTLAPIPALSPEEPELDPLAGLQRLAVIQPRGLSPADNVALDNWVRGGGKLLLVLDPVLTGEYSAALGDPRRPVETALVLPVVERWGLDIGFAIDETEEGYYRTIRLPGGAELPLAYFGMIEIANDVAGRCRSPDSAIVTCQIGKGQVALIADAALFEHPELAGEGGEQLLAVMAFAFE